MILYIMQGCLQRGNNLWHVISRDSNKANWQDCVGLHRVNLGRAGCQSGGSSWRGASETAGGPDISGQVPSHRARLLEQVVAGVE